jgi:hypothetical protein
MQIFEAIAFSHEKLLMVVACAPQPRKPLEEGKFRDVPRQRWFFFISRLTL